MFPITVGIALSTGLVAFTCIMIQRLSLLRTLKGERDGELCDIRRRLAGALEFAFGQKRLLFRDRCSGLMHAFIFWGFCVISLRTITLFGQGFIAGFQLPFLNGNIGYIYSYSKDLTEIMVLIGVAALLFRRIAIRSKRLTLSLEANLILITIAMLMITDFMIEGFGIQAGVVNPESVSTIALWIASTIGAHGISQHASMIVHDASYLTHIFGILAFLNYLPFGKHFHIITAIPNVFLRRLSPLGRLPHLNLEDESATSFGTKKIADLNWKQGLDLMSCTECGRCSDECPAASAGKKLDPKKLSIAMRNHLYSKSKSDLVPDTVSPEELWDCTTCRACEEACPLFIEYVDKIISMRRNLVLMKGDFPSEAQAAMRNIETNSNPWGIGFGSRGDWAKGLGVETFSSGAKAEYLYFVGCAGSFDERAKKISRSFVKCLQMAGVSFAILGAEEKCTGDSARRIGNEYLFQTLAKENIETFNRYGIKKIITTCPHCYNTIKNEYPKFGGNFEVIHHSELLSDLIQSAKLQIKDSTNITATFHDSCYLGRYNGIYDTPREILKSIKGVEIEEPKLSLDRGRCCGAGGGRMWMEEKTGDRINHARLKDLTSSGKSSLIATACPFCLTMLEDATKETQTRGIETKDIAEILSERL